MLLLLILLSLLVVLSCVLCIIIETFEYSSIYLLFIFSLSNIKFVGILITGKNKHLPLSGRYPTHMKKKSSDVITMHCLIYSRCIVVVLPESHLFLLYEIKRRENHRFDATSNLSSSLFLSSSSSSSSSTRYPLKNARTQRENPVSV